MAFAYISIFISLFQGNVTKTVTLVVLDSDAPQCEKNTTKTNKGIYIWKETIHNENQQGYLYMERNDCRGNERVAV